jgi:protein-tyrosine phosphatase
MRRFVDLHCHWIAGIDDGPAAPADGVAILRALGALGFELVVATPHMRPGMFDNTRDDLSHAYERMLPHLKETSALPRVALSSEHYFDEIVYERLLNGDGLPYPGSKAALLEFYEIDFPPAIDQRLFDLRRRQILPVIAHPERYRCIWRSVEVLERLVEAGAAALLDTAALVGKYGRQPQLCAEALLDRGLYHAACSDAHRVRDVAEVEAGMRRLERVYGADAVDYLFCFGPTELLAGRLPD